MPSNIDGVEITEPDKARFWSNVDRRGADECWTWLAGTSSGYGNFRVGKRNVYAHHMAYLLEKGPLASGEVRRHSCDNPRCCNPAHLVPGTQGQNMGDMKSRDRCEHSDRHHNAKLRSADIPAILEARRSGEFFAVIGQRYGVTESAIRKVVSGKRWQRVRRLLPEDASEYDPALY